MEQVCILGADATRIDRWQAKSGITDLELLDKAVTSALTDAGLGRADVGMLSFTTPGAGTLQKLFSSYATARLGFRHAGKVVESGTGGWIGGLAFDAAVQEVACGRSQVAAALGVWMESGIDTATAMDGAIRSTGDVGFQTPSGATPLSWYAMDAARWLYETTGTRADLAAIAVKNRRHAQLNPLSQLTEHLTVSEVLTARPIVEPCGLYDVAPRGDGAACLLLCSEAIARASGRPYSVVRTVNFAHDGHFQTSGRPGPVFPYASLAKAAEKALAAAKITLADIDLFELYAPLTIVEAIAVETLGLAPMGQGGKLASEGVTALGGKHPVNVSGGLLSRGHPTGVTALYDLYELHLQLTGQAGARQVKAAQRGMAVCETGKFNGAMVSILEQGGVAMIRLALYGSRPVPALSAYGLAAHDRAMAMGQPMMQRCSACETPRFPPAPVCPACQNPGAIEEPLPETGTLFAATTLHAAPGALARKVPYAVGLVDLTHGPRLLLPLLSPSGWTPACDTSMRLLLTDYIDGSALAAFPASAVPADLIHEPREEPMPAPARPSTTRALVARKAATGYATGFEDLPLTALPEGDVLVRVDYSALNYKDALALTGKGPIIRSFPMVPGIDLAGEVAESRTPQFRPGDQVLVNGFGLSETRWGGYSRYQSLPGSFLVKRPAGLSAETAMQIGTAGYTAMLCVMALNDHGLHPGKDAVLITGASGGVGSVALSLLAAQGFAVIAVTGRPEQEAFLRELGATDVISRQDLSAGGKALARERWAGVVDVAGGQTLSDALAQTRYDGIVTSCGMAGGGDLPATVYPFILRGVTLRGIDSVMVPMERRITAWDRLDKELDRALLAKLGVTCDFADLPKLAADLLDGRLHGRVAIRL